MNCDKCEHDYAPTDDEVRRIFLERGIFGEVTVSAGPGKSENEHFREARDEITIAFTPHDGPTLRRCYYKEEAIKLGKDIIEKAKSIKY